MGVADCPNHPGVAVKRRCTLCQEDYCPACVQPTPQGPCCPACRESPDLGPAPAKKGSNVAIIIAVLAVCFVLVIPIIAIVAAIAIPNLLHARKTANERAAIGSLRTLLVAQSVFREGDKEQDGDLDYGMLSELSNVTLIDSVLGSGKKQGYFFEAAYSTTTSEFLWWGMARPQVPGSSGDRTFYVNAQGVIYYVPTTDAHAPPPPRPNARTCDIPTGAVPVGR